MTSLYEKAVSSLHKKTFVIRLYRESVLLGTLIRKDLDGLWNDPSSAPINTRILYNTETGAWMPNPFEIIDDRRLKKLAEKNAFFAHYRIGRIVID